MRGALMRRRTFVAAAAALLLAHPAAAPAQSSDEIAGQEARRFLADLIATGAGGDAAAMEAFLRDRVDMGYAFDAAFEPVAGIVTQGQRQRLTELMMRFMSREALMVADMARGGEFRLTGTRRGEDGIQVEGVFHDAAGNYPFFVLMGEGAMGARPPILDLGSPLASSVVAKLRYATTSLALVTTDADLWIEAFEKAVGG